MLIPAFTSVAPILYSAVLPSAQPPQATPNPIKKGFTVLNANIVSDGTWGTGYFSVPTDFFQATVQGNVQGDQGLLCSSPGFYNASALQQNSTANTNSSSTPALIPLTCGDYRQTTIVGVLQQQDLDPEHGFTMTMLSNNETLGAWKVGNVSAEGWTRDDKEHSNLTTPDSVGWDFQGPLLVM